MIPIALWFVVLPLIVKVKFYENPLSGYPWYSSESMLADFFLYYKCLSVTITIAPLYWALLGIGIGINHRIRSAQS